MNSSSKHLLLPQHQQPPLNNSQHQVAMTTTTRTTDPYYHNSNYSSSLASSVSSSSSSTSSISNYATTTPPTTITATTTPTTATVTTVAPSASVGHCVPSNGGSQLYHASYNQNQTPYEQSTLAYNSSTQLRQFNVNASTAATGQQSTGIFNSLDFSVSYPDQNSSNQSSSTLVTDFADNLNELSENLFPNEFNYNANSTSSSNNNNNNYCYQSGTQSNSYGNNYWPTASTTSSAYNITYNNQSYYDISNLYPNNQIDQKTSQIYDAKQNNELSQKPLNGNYNYMQSSATNSVPNQTAPSSVMQIKSESTPLISDLDLELLSSSPSSSTQQQQVYYANTYTKSYNNYGNIF